MLFSAVQLPVSGILLHDSSAHGSARLKFIAMAFHNVAAVVFAVSAAIHVKYNWKAIINYLKDKQVRLLKYPREMAIAGSTLAILLLLSVIHVLHNHW
jgi:hypothetical protein